MQRAVVYALAIHTQHPLPIGGELELVQGYLETEELPVEGDNDWEDKWFRDLMDKLHYTTCSGIFVYYLPSNFSLSYYVYML